MKTSPIGKEPIQRIVSISVTNQFRSSLPQTKFFIVIISLVVTQCFAYYQSPAQGLSTYPRTQPSFPSIAPSAKSITTRSLIRRTLVYDFETIAIPGSRYTALIRTTAHYLPVTAACAALEAFYNHIIEKIYFPTAGDITFIIGSGTSSSLSARMYPLGELRFVIQYQAQNVLIGWDHAYITLLRLLLERVRLGMPLAREGILLRPEYPRDLDDYIALIILALGVADI